MLCSVMCPGRGEALTAGEANHRLRTADGERWDLNRRGRGGRHETAPALVSWQTSGRTLRLKCVVSTIASAKSGSTQKILKPTVSVRVPGGDQHREFTASEELAVWAEVAVRFGSDSVVDQALRRQRIEFRLQLTGAVKSDAEDRNRAALQL